jgi:hypothetical protein
MAILWQKRARNRVQKIKQITTNLHILSLNAPKSIILSKERQKMTEK